MGAIALMAAIGIVVGTFGFRSVPGQQFGSAFYPRIVAGGLAVLGIAFLFTGDRSAPATTAEWMRSSRAFKAVALPVGGLLWITLAPEIGFIATTFFLILALILILGGRLTAGIGVAAGLAFLLYCVFAVLLRVPLPHGVVERLLS